MASLGGTYFGIEPMGLMWSLTAEKGVQAVEIYSAAYNDRIYIKRNIISPVKVTINAYEGHEKFEHASDLQSSNLIAHQTVQRLYMSPQCQRITVREGRLRGTLFVPNGTGPFSAVLEIYCGAGGLQEARASLLASHQYVTFALAFYAFEDLPAKAEEAELEYFLEAIDYLLSLKYVEKSGVGILGICHSSALALHLSIICPKVKAVVSVSGASYLIGANVRYQNKIILATSYFEKAQVTDEGIINVDAFPVAEEKCIPIEEAVNCKFLLIYGEDDQTIP